MDDARAETVVFSTGFSAGSRIAGYRVEEQIGQGGMAVVFRARDDRLQRQVALKILSPALAADESFRRRFIRESRSAAAVDHPNIIPVFEAGNADGVLFLAMRYVPGGDAGTLVSRYGPLPWPRAAAIISAVASALDAAHAAGLVHRDVKPANMLVDTRPGRADHVYLSDFGLTKGAVATAALTGVGHFMGTVDYSAPEQIMGGAVDGRTDEYALACAAFELLSGRAPFPRDDPMNVLYAHQSTPPPPLTSRRPDLPPAVDEVLLRALAKPPERRFPSCGEFAAALTAALATQPATTPATTPPPAHAATQAARTIWPPQAAATPPATPAPPYTPTAPHTPAPHRLARPARTTSRRRGVIALLSIAALAAGSTTAALLLTAPAHPADHPTASQLHVKLPATQRTHSSSNTTTTPAAPRYQIVHTLPDPAGSGKQQISSVAFSGNGATLITGDMDGNAYLWSTTTGHQTQALSGSTGAKVFSAALSPDGTLAATGDSNGSTYLWQTATGQLISTIPDPQGNEVNWVAFSPDGNTLATADKNGSTYLWDVSAPSHTATLKATLTDPAGAGVWAVAFSPDGTTVATGDFVGNTYLWHVAAAGSGPAQTFTMSSGHSVTAVAFSPDGTLLATGNDVGTTDVWHIATGTHTVYPEPAAVWGLAISKSGLLAIGDGTGSTYLWNLAKGTEAATLPDPATGSQGVGALAFSANGQLLATGDTNGTTYLWRLS